LHQGDQYYQQIYLCMLVETELTQAPGTRVWTCFKDIILRCSETFSDRYGIEDLKITTQRESILSSTAEKHFLRCMRFYKDGANVNEEAA